MGHSSLSFASGSRSLLDACGDQGANSALGRRRKCVVIPPPSPEHDRSTAPVFFPVRVPTFRSSMYIPSHSRRRSAQSHHSVHFIRCMDDMFEQRVQP